MSTAALDPDRSTGLGTPTGGTFGENRSGWLTLGLLLGIAVVSGIAMILAEERLAVGALGLVLMLAMIFLRIPIAFCLLVPGLLGLWSMRGFRLVESIFSATPYKEIASWSLSVIPMFILVGMLLSASRLTSTLYTTVQQWLWWLPGSLSVGTNVAGAGLAAVSGSTMGTSYALGRVGIPQMLRAGYDRRVAVLAVMAAGLPGQLIPPSILMTFYAGMVETPVGPQLLAGLIPGLLIAGIFSLIFIGIAIIMSRGRGTAIARDKKAPLPVMLRSLLAAWPVPVLMIIIIGGMFSGFFTATEAGAAAAAVAAILAVMACVRAKNWAAIRTAAFDTVTSTGMIFFLVIGAMVLSEMLTHSGISREFANMVSDLGFNRITFLLAMIIVYLVLGTGMDTLAMIALTVPVLIPTLERLDISLLWFGVFVVLLGELAVLTPPVGVLTYVIYGMVQDPKVNLGQSISLRDVFTAVAWVLPGAILVLLILILFPELATVLPEMARSGG